MEARLTEYTVYLLVSVGLTVWVGTTLFRSGRMFLVDVFKQEGLADSVNHLLVVGFYLVNLGAVALLITADTALNSSADVVQAVVGKIGLVLLILGAMHFLNLFILSRIRRPARQRANQTAQVTAPQYPPPYAPPQV